MDSNQFNETENNAVNSNPYESNYVQPAQDAYQQNTTNQNFDSYTGQPVNGQYTPNYNNVNVQPAQQKASGLAIASLVCGILSLVCCCVWYLSVILAIVALVLGIVNNVKGFGGRGMAIGGIVTGAIGLVLAIAIIVLALLGASSGVLTEMLEEVGSI